MKKKIRIWNGRASGSKYPRYHVFVAAYSVKQAVELLNRALFKNGMGHISAYEIEKYYSPDCWGSTMDGILPTEPCVYLHNPLQFGRTSPNKPFRVL